MKKIKYGNETGTSYVTIHSQFEWANLNKLGATNVHHSTKNSIICQLEQKLKAFESIGH